MADKMAGENKDFKKLSSFRKILKRRKPVFLRKDSFKKSKLGKRRKKKQKWRRPRGRHSKLREKRTGHMIQPSIGWRSPRKVRGFVQEFRPRVIYNPGELENFSKDEIAVLGKVGQKKKIEIVEKAMEKNIKILNVNTKKFIEKIKAEREEKLKKKEAERAKEKTVKKEEKEKVEEGREKMGEEGERK